MDQVTAKEGKVLKIRNNQIWRLVQNVNWAINLKPGGEPHNFKPQKKQLNGDWGREVMEDFSNALRRQPRYVVKEV